MTLKPVVNVPCPCCGEILEIDVAQERVRAHRKAPGASAPSSTASPAAEARTAADPLVAAVRGQKTAAERAADDFAAATRKVKRGDSELDRLFRDAKKKVKQAGDTFDDSGIGPKWD
jgi:hypothetical protein